MIGYYVHHHGAGHARRAQCVADRLGAELVGLGRGPVPHRWAGGGWIELPPDDGADPVGAARGGAWHWLPAGHDACAERMRALARWIECAQPDLLVSDASVEVLTLAALLGVRTAMVVLPGERTDRPHRLAYDSADGLLGPWPESHRELWHEADDRLVTTGAFSRFDRRPRRVRSPFLTGEAAVPRVVVMAGPGPHPFDATALDRAAAATPGWRWETLGPIEGTGPALRVHGWLDDPWPVLFDAAVVVAAAGDAAVAEIAAARRPAVLLPQPRPFDEQRARARAVAADGAPVAVHDVWPAPEAWPAVLACTAAMDGQGWAGYVDGRGADRFADRILELAGRPARAVEPWYHPSAHVAPVDHVAPPNAARGPGGQLVARTS